MDVALEAVKEAFCEHGLGRTQMPPKSYLYFKSHNGDLRTMPAYLEKIDSAGVKIVNVHTGNASKGLPTVMALMVLNSTETGAPKAVMGATYLTAMRTGAAGGIAAKNLARPGSETVGLIGAGAQARTQLLALSKLFFIREVFVADTSIERCASFKKDCQAFLDCSYNLTTDPKEASECDILVTTTPSRKPIVRDEWILPGTHINAIGADAKGKQELEPAILRRSKVVVDDMVQATHSGEVNVSISAGELSPGDIYAEIGDIVAGKVPGRANEEEITVFDSTGLAIQDVATANRVYSLARGKGVSVKFI